MDLSSHVGLSTAPSLEPGEQFAGQPDFCWLDILNRPVASICFPFWEGTVVTVDRSLLRMTAMRSQHEQTAVSQIYNSGGALGAHLRPGAEDMHASHSAKHGQCGSSYRSNLHPVSRHCNVVTIGDFEKNQLIHWITECYGGSASRLDLSTHPSVLVQITYTGFDWHATLRTLVSEEWARFVELNSKRLLPGYLQILAEMIPCRQVRELWVGTRDPSQPGGRRWDRVGRLELNLPMIMERAGSPDAPRYRLPDPDAAEEWFGAVFLTNPGSLNINCATKYQIGVRLDQVAINCTMFNFLARISGLADSPLMEAFERERSLLGGVQNPVQQMSEIAAEARLPAHVAHPGEPTVREGLQLRLTQLQMGVEVRKDEVIRFVEGVARGDPELARYFKMRYLGKFFAECKARCDHHVRITSRVKPREAERWAALAREFEEAAREFDLSGQ